MAGRRKEETLDMSVGEKDVYGYTGTGCVGALHGGVADFIGSSAVYHWLVAAHSAYLQ